MTEYDKIIMRGKDLKLSFEQIYYLAMGDYPSEGSVKTLARLCAEALISEESFITLMELKNEKA